MNFQKTLRGEVIKIKRTSLLYFTILAAAFTPLVVLFDNIDGTPDKGLQEDPFRSFYLEGYQFVAFIFIPLFIVLITTLLMQIEYKNNTWKQVLASPQPLYSILLSKFLVVQGLVILMMVIFNLIMIAIGQVIDLRYPDFKVLSYLDQLTYLCALNARTYIGSLGLAALQFWLALRFRNFIVPLGIGLALWAISPILLFELDWVTLMDKFPYAMTIVASLKRFEPIHVWVQGLSVMYMIVFMVMAYVDFGRRKMKV